MKCDNRALIPRPETETLIEHILCRVPKSFDGKILDLGIGSGAILFALCSSLGSASGIGIDKSEEALSLARENLLLHDLVDRVELRQLDWFSEKIELGEVDLIVSNPPYIPDSDRHLEEGDVRFEPASALVSGSDGLDDLRLIISQAPDWLVEGGWLLVEHGFDQAEAVAQLFHTRGFKAVETRQDYGNRDRMTLGQWSSGA